MLSARNVTKTKAVFRKNEDRIEVDNEGLIDFTNV